MSIVRKVHIHDGLGNGLESLNGALGIHDADVHTTIINEYFHRLTGVVDTLAVAPTAGATSITVTNGGLFLAGQHLEIRNGNKETTYPEITSILGNVLTLDRPLDYSFSIGNTVSTVAFDMNVLGTLANPVSFKLIPDPTQIWHIVRFLFTMTHATGGDLGKFGNIDNPLTNGVVIRGYNATANQHRTFTNWKSNSEIKDDMYDVNFDARASGGGTFGTTGRGSLKIGTGAVPYLDGAAGDYVEILIQDDLTSLLSFRIKAQGHVEGA